jgi:hypothetical protein
MRHYAVMTLPCAIAQDEAGAIASQPLPDFAYRCPSWRKHPSVMIDKFVRSCSLSVKEMIDGKAAVAIVLRVEERSELETMPPPAGSSVAVSNVTARRNS